MKSKLRTTFDRYGEVVTGHIEDIEMYDAVVSGDRWWRNGLYSQITHIRLPKKKFEELLAIDRQKRTFYLERPCCKDCACSKVCEYCINENASDLERPCVLEHWQNYFVPAFKEVT